MGDDYQDLVELGFEGLDRVTDKYYDTLYGAAGKRPHLFRGKGQRGAAKQAGNQGPPKDNDRGPPPQESRQRARSERRDRRRGSDEDGDNRRAMYTDERRRSRDREADYGYAPDARDRGRGLYADDGALVARGWDQPAYRGGYDVAARGPSPQYMPDRRQVATRNYGGYDDDWEDTRRRPGPSRRPSSYSPPRRTRHDSPPRKERLRSKSPNHHRMVATVAGGLAGALAGQAVKKDNKVALVGGAVVGALIGRAGEELYDRFEDKRAEKKAEKSGVGERRERRRERESGYDY